MYFSRDGNLLQLHAKFFALPSFFFFFSTPFSISFYFDLRNVELTFFSLSFSLSWNSKILNAKWKKEKATVVNFILDLSRVLFPFFFSNYAIST